MVKYLETIILITELEGILIYKYMVFLLLITPLIFVTFLIKFGAYLEKELVYNKISLIQILS